MASLAVLTNARDAEGAGFGSAAHLRSFGDLPALLQEDGTAVAYKALDDLVTAFAVRLTHGRGLLALDPSNTVACIVAYLGAFRANCPVIFRNSAAPPFPCLYEYHPESDILLIEPAGAGLDIHPDLALLLSTSGSTGAAKSVRLSYGNLDSNARAIADYLELGPRDRAPTNLPLHYSYGLSVLNSHLAAGGALLLTDRTVLDAAFWSAFSAAGCTGFAGVPHTYDLLEASPFDEARLPLLRYATQAGGKLAPERVASWAARAARGNWKFFVMYGQTEAAPRMAYLPPELAGDHPDCIGRPIPNGRFSLIDDAGQEIAASDEPGELVYHGPNVMMGYATQVADLARGPEIDGLKTGDIALRTSEGLYRIIGRQSRFIKPFGLRISLEEVEARLGAQGFEAACAAGPDESLRVLIATEETADLAPVRAGLERWLAIPGSAISMRAVRQIPRRENGKIDTAAVRELAAGMASLPDREARRENSREAISHAFVSRFGHAAEDGNASYRSLEGDSLSYIDMMLELQRLVPDLPDDWDLRTIDELCRLAASSNASVPAERKPVYQPGNFDTVRGLACLLIVAVHVLGVRESQGLEIARPSIWHAVMDALEVLRLPLFTAMAGYIYGAMPATRTGFSGYMTLKMKQLAIPVLFANGFFWALKYFMLGDEGRGLFQTYVHGYEHLWYIYSILLMFAFVSAVDQLIRPTVRTWLVIAALAVVAYWLVPLGTITYVKKGVLLLPFFILGIVIQRNSQWMKQPVVTVLAAVLLAGSIWMVPLGQEAAIGLDETGLVTWIGGTSAVVLLLLYMPRFSGLEVLAAYSFTIYLWHPAASAATRTLLWKLGLQDLAVMFMVGLAMGVGVPILMHLVLRRFPKLVSIPIIGK